MSGNENRPNSFKVYILYNVLCDYTCGCIIVAAKDKEDAIRKIYEEFSQDDLYTEGRINRHNIIDQLVEVTKDTFTYIWGGG